MGHIDNDASLTVSALNGGGNDKIYRNNGDGTFTDITASQPKLLIITRRDPAFSDTMTEKLTLHRQRM